MRSIQNSIVAVATTHLYQALAYAVSKDDCSAVLTTDLFLRMKNSLFTTAPGTVPELQNMLTLVISVFRSEGHLKLATQPRTTSGATVSSDGLLSTQIEDTASFRVDSSRARRDNS